MTDIQIDTQYSTGATRQAKNLTTALADGRLRAIQGIARAV